MRQSLIFLLVVLIFSLAVPGLGQAPAPQSGAAPVASENAAKAQALLNQAIQALGGDAYLNIEEVSQQGRAYSFFHGETTSAGVQFWRFTKFPDKERMELTKQRDIAYVYNGIHGYEITYKGTAMLDAKTLGDYLRRRDHSLEWVLRRWIKEPGVALFYEGSTIAADKQADQVTIMNAQNDSVTLYLDSTTHLPIKKTFTWRDPTDKLRNTEDELYDAYRATQGIMTPYSVTRYYNGDMSNQRFLNTVSYNNPANPSMFEANQTYDPSAVPPPKK